MANLIRVTLLLVFFVMSFTSLISIQSASAQDDLLPDLFPPNYLQVTQTITIMGWDISNQVVPGRIYLRVNFGVANIGAGPLFLRGDSVLNPDSTWNAYQRIFRTDSTWWERLVGVFEITPDHGHAHFRDWAAYRLREYFPGDSVGAILASAEKVTFCIADFIQYDLTLPGATNETVFWNCDPNGQGLSIGWMDVYNVVIPGQYFDITDIPNGVYWLEGVVDPSDRILESNEENNTALLKIQLCHSDIAIPQSDSLWISSAKVYRNSQVRVDVQASNATASLGFIVPFSWGGPLNLSLDSASTAGLRTSDFNLISFPPFPGNPKAVAYKLTAPDTSMWIEPGSGPILSLYFSAPNLPSGIVDSINSIVIEQLETEIEGITIDPTFYEVCGAYTPPNILSGSISMGCCDIAGDADLGGDVSVADATFLVKFIFQSGDAPPCDDQADADGNNEVNISDATYLIKYIFQGGLGPLCGATGT